LPQLTPVGKVFAYNNAAVATAGHVIEVVTGKTYEDVVRAQLLDPLELANSFFFSDETVGFNVAASHAVVGGQPKVEPKLWSQVGRSLYPTGGLISSARDQLQYARFHLGDGTAPDGTRLLSQASLVAMRSNPGPGGTLLVELDGVGVNWMLRPSAEGVRIVQHGGTPSPPAVIITRQSRANGISISPSFAMSEQTGPRFFGLTKRTRGLSLAEAGQ